MGSPMAPSELIGESNDTMSIEFPCSNYWYMTSPLVISTHPTHTDEGHEDCISALSTKCPPRGLIPITSAFFMAILSANLINTPDA